MRGDDPAYAAELEPLRSALELDRFGFVRTSWRAARLHRRRIAALARFRDGSRVLANLRDGTFDDELGKYAARWNAPAATPVEPAGSRRRYRRGAAQTLGPAPVPVSPRSISRRPVRFPPSTSWRRTGDAGGGPETRSRRRLHQRRPPRCRRAGRPRAGRRRPPPRSRARRPRSRHGAARCPPNHSSTADDESAAACILSRPYGW